MVEARPERLAVSSPRAGGRSGEGIRRLHDGDAVVLVVVAEEGDDGRLVRDRGVQEARVEGYHGVEVGGGGAEDGVGERRGGGVRAGIRWSGVGVWGEGWRHRGCDFDGRGFFCSFFVFGGGRE